jgi:hypothetical protein
MAIALVLLLLAVTALGNPLIPGVDVWMASEKLSTSISPSNATVVGTFSFEWTAGRRYPTEVGVTMHMELPIWLPDPCQDPRLQSFWRAYEQKPRAPETLRLLESALYLRAEVGGNVVHAQQASECDGRSSGGGDYFSASVAREHPEVVQETGFRCLILHFTFSPRLLQPGVPVKAWVAYRQPLAPSAECNRFFYVPFFLNQPTNAVTIDTNRHSIIITATPGCSLAVSNGGQACAIGPSRSATFSPIHGQCIRVSAKPWANPQGGANGRQPIGSETNGTAAAAASRRSP